MAQLEKEFWENPEIGTLDHIDQKAVFTEVMQELRTIADEMLIQPLAALRQTTDDQVATRFILEAMVDGLIRVGLAQAGLQDDTQPDPCDLQRLLGLSSENAADVFIQRSAEDRQDGQLTTIGEWASVITDELLSQ